MSFRITALEENDCFMTVHEGVPRFWRVDSRGYVAETDCPAPGIDYTLKEKA